MIHTAIERVIARQDLTRDEAYSVLRSILNGEANDAQIAGLLVALAMKGETVEEIVGFARAMREEVTPVGRPRENNVLDASGTGHDALLPAQSIVDTCGTGGDASGTFNISTATAFTVAGAGVCVAKHGNRSISSRCGSADVIEALGVNINLPASAMSACLEEVGMAFLFAPALHTAMRYVQPARRALRVRTIFNLLGPLTNPAGAQSQVVGVYAAPLAEKLAYALRELGTRHAFVVHSEDGLDEISTTAPTRIAEVRDGRVASYVLDARDYGFPRSTLAELAGGDVNANVSAVRSVLAGEAGPKRDITVLNAAAALVAASRVTRLEDGIALATESLDSGSAAKVLERLVAFTNSALANARA